MAYTPCPVNRSNALTRHGHHHLHAEEGVGSDFPSERLTLHPDVTQEAV